jgi:hypothetical protein
MKIILNTANEYIPAVPPPQDDRPARSNPTTQVMVQVAEWPGNTFRLWLPEHVHTGLWSNSHPDEALQEFVPTSTGGLLWTFERHPSARIEAEVAPAGNGLLLEVRVTNRLRVSLQDVSVGNCCQLSQAPDFTCDDLTRLFIRTGGQWRRLSELRPKSNYPTYYRLGYLERGGAGIWAGKLDALTEEARGDHPLMVCVSKDGRRAVGTASEDYYMLFHNRNNKHLLCIHSSQAPRPTLGPGETVTFRQRLYFADGGLEACIAAYGEGHGKE